jgi:hypothetical protein
MATVFQVKKVNLADGTEPEAIANDGGFLRVNKLDWGKGTEAIFTEDKVAFLESKFVKQAAVTEPQSARLNGQEKKSDESPKRRRLQQP